MNETEDALKRLAARITERFDPLDDRIAMIEELFHQLDDRLNSAYRRIRSVEDNQA